MTEAVSLTPGDPVPWFDARTLAGTRHSLGVMAGRWIALCFVEDLADHVVTRTLADIVAALGRFFNDDHVIFYAVMTAPTPLADAFAQASHRGLGFITDDDRAISMKYGAAGSPRLVVIDPMLRFARAFPLGENGASSQEICDYLGHLPPVERFAGAPLPAPALVIPNVFEPDLCDRLIDLHQKNGGKDTGFMRDEEGKTRVITDHEYKSRTDFMLEDDLDLCATIRGKIVRRVVPMMERFFRYRPTRMERYMVSCYDTETGGHFSRHRDDVNKGAEHRRFAASLNLNDDFEGCGLMFPEFGRALHKPPRGGMVVFSTGALHEVMPMTRGKRYAFIPFFYGEDDARLRLENNAKLHKGEKLYSGEGDRLFDIA